ncbi:MAG: TrbC/VirB2 family protein [Asticcacaulis sp.]|uniref:TrbC/VirB2 family protein n=1 Tax=Asticcacaulis sp. TaxID=1872648 RepID=UPI003F7C75B6
MKVSTKKIVSGAGVALGYGLVAASPCFAQVSQLTSGLDWIKSTITGIGVVVIVIAIMWTGIQMMFQHAKWSQVAHIFFGGILVGGAAAIGPQLFGGGSGG